jgi:hypothetical protein
MSIDENDLRLTRSCSRRKQKLGSNERPAISKKPEKLENRIVQQRHRQRRNHGNRHSNSDIHLHTHTHTMPSHLSSISASFPSPTSSPILIDTAVIFLIQAAYYLLSKRFLLHALPTLRQISKRAPEEEQPGSDGGILGLPGLVEDGDEDDEGMINASGGLSDTGSISLSRPGGGSSGKRRETMDDVDDSDTDSILSYAVGSPSPAISGRPSMDEFPLLPLHATDPSAPSGSRHQRNTSLGIPAHPEALGKRLKEVKIRAPGVSGNARRGIEPRKKVLRLFHGKRAREGDGDRVRTTKGLGWLARYVFPSHVGRMGG